MRVQWVVPMFMLLAAPALVSQSGNVRERQNVQRRRAEAGAVRLRQPMPDSTSVYQVFVDRRPRLGITVDLRAGDTDSTGALVQTVTPGGPAARAGIRSGDIITKLDGHSLLESDDSDAEEGQSVPGVRLIMLASRLQPNDTISVELQRGRDRRTVRLVTEGNQPAAYSFNQGPSGMLWKQFSDSSHGGFGRGYPTGQFMPQMRELTEIGPAGMSRLGFMIGSSLGDLELAPLNDDLGSYFGTTDGVLVVSVPRESKLNLKGGDVILSVDGRKPSSPSHLMRILQSYDGSEDIRMEIMRNHHRETVSGSIDGGGRGRSRD